MTTVAWDGVWLAADRMATYGNVKREVLKIVEAGPFFYGMSGSAAECELLREWLAGGERPKFDEPGVGGIAVRKENGAAFVVEGKTPVLTRIIGKWAVGSGTDFALSAMALGMSAQAAVRFAMKYDIGTGFGVDKVRITKPSKRERSKR